MVIVAGTIDVEAGKRDDFLRAREATIVAARSEPGCIEYAFSGDSVDPGRVRVFEMWESKEALAKHLDGFKNAPPPAAADIQIVGSDLLQHEISASGPLGS